MLDLVRFEANAVEETVRVPRLVRFGAFEVDLRAGELRYEGAKLKLTGQPFQVLTILLEQPGEVVEETIRAARLVRFGAFEVDLRAGELRKHGAKLKLTGQPLQVLTILLEQPNEVVTRDELQKRLWPDTFVDVDHNLNTAINKIREVLGDSGRVRALSKRSRDADTDLYRR